MDRAKAIAFVEGYRSSWERWDIEAFVDLFAEEVVYVAHPDEAVHGREALAEYLRKERVEQGAVSVRMGRPVLEGRDVVAEFWATADGGDATFAGCFIARLDPADGRCLHFREYWFDLEGRRDPFAGWGE
jgi:hypothetical protein